MSGQTSFFANRDYRALGLHRCFCCDRIFRNSPRLARTEDGQIVEVGHGCMRKILVAGSEGYQPPKGGPRLFKMKGGQS